MKRIITIRDCIFLGVGIVRLGDGPPHAAMKYKRCFPNIYNYQDCKINRERLYGQRDNEQASGSGVEPDGNGD